MTTANSIVTAQTLNTGTAICTAAKTTYNDTANAVLLLTAGGSGALVFDVSAVPRATITATQAQLFTSSDGGVTLNFLRSELMAAYTMASTTQAAETPFEWSETNPLRLKANERLYSAIGVALAGGVVFHARGEDL